MWTVHVRCRTGDGKLGHLSIIILLLLLLLLHLLSLQGALASQDPMLRCAAGEALGRLSQVRKFPVKLIVIYMYHEAG